MNEGWMGVEAPLRSGLVFMVSRFVCEGAGLLSSQAPREQAGSDSKRVPAAVPRLWSLRAGVAPPDRPPGVTAGQGGALGRVALRPLGVRLNSEWGSCSRGKGRMARREEGGYPSAVSDRRATKPGGPFLENPPGGGSFGRALRWLRRYSPLRGCAGLAASITPKIPRRRTPLTV